MFKRRTQPHGHQRYLHRQQDRLMYSAPAGSTVLIDRNCHNALDSTDDDERHHAGSTRPDPQRLRHLGDTFRRASSSHHHRQTREGDPNATWPVHAVITNSTYDGPLYNTDFIKNTLDVKSIHFDSPGCLTPTSTRSEARQVRHERRPRLEGR